MNNRAYSARYAAFLSALQDARLESGLTQVELAARLGETQSFVSKCERGTRRVDIAELQAFCQAMCIPLSKLVARL
jgi:transcriptional regulator with XRE-family HTH domain